MKENSGTWKRVTPEGLTAIFSIAVDGNTIYVGTMDRGVLHFTLD
ncbi:MAG: PQQ-binding-like beta-propeller repeat protein [Candidatus Poribacteria bacterium]|nr:PQQ-binding-like beta-propeller repeat protein [Candidatus Poribacteria bacterium]